MNRNSILIQGAFLALQQKQTYNKKWIGQDILLELLVELQLLPPSLDIAKKWLSRTITRAVNCIDDIYNTTGIIRMYTQVKGVKK